MSGLYRTGEGERVIVLADGRVLFLPWGRGGRAYHVPDDDTAIRLERQIAWAWRISGYGAAATIGAAAFLQNWWLLLVVFPALLLPEVVSQALVSRYPEANDPAARVEVTAVPEGSGSLGQLLGLAAGGGFALLMWSWRSHRGAEAVFELAMITVAFVIAVVGVLRHRRALSERDAYGRHTEPTNEPINPR